MNTTERKELLTQVLEPVKEWVHQNVSADNPEIAAMIKQGVEDTIRNAGGASIAELGEKLDTVITNSNEAMEQMKKDMDARLSQRFANTDDRLRIQGGAYSGMPIENLGIMQAIAQYKANEGVDKQNELDAVNQSVASTLKNLTRDDVEAHFDAMKQRQGYRTDASLQAIENGMFGRVGAKRLPTFDEETGARQLLVTQAQTSPGPGALPPPGTTAVGSAVGELMAPTLDAMLWQDIMMGLDLVQRIPQVAMPSASHYMPSMDDTLMQALGFAVGGTGTYTGSATAQTASVADQDAEFHRVRLQARTIMLAASLSQDAIEDSVINLASEIRNTMVRAGQIGLENFVLNSDSQTSAANINANGSSNGVVNRLGSDGLRKYAQITGGADTRIDANNAAPDARTPTNLRARLREGGLNANDFFYAMNYREYYQLLAITEFARYDSVANLGTYITGRMDRLMATPVVVCHSFPEATTAAGVSGGDRGSILAVLPQLWRLGVYVPFQLMSALGQGGTVGAPARSSINPPGMNFLLRGRYAIQHRSTEAENNFSRPAAITYNLARS